RHVVRLPAAHHDPHGFRNGEPHVLRDPGIEDRGRSHAECDTPDRTGMGRVRVRADNHHAGLRMSLEDLGVAYRGMPRGEAERLCAGLASDAGAEYCEVIEIDAAAIRPMMALPGDPGNGQYIDAAARIRVDIAYAGSCTAGKKEDMDMYARVL